MSRDELEPLIRGAREPGGQDIDSLGIGLLCGREQHERWSDDGGSGETATGDDVRTINEVEDQNVGGGFSMCEGGLYRTRVSRLMNCLSIRGGLSGRLMELQFVVDETCILYAAQRRWKE